MDCDTESADEKSTEVDLKVLRIFMTLSGCNEFLLSFPNFICTN